MTALKSQEISRPSADDKGTVLVVDDDPAWVNECCFMLEQLGYATARAHTIAEAFDRLNDPAIATVIIDYRMPGGDGISVIYAMAARNAHRPRKLHFILATGYPSMDVAISAMRASAVDMLEKPFTATALSGTLMRINALREEHEGVDDVRARLDEISDELRRLRQSVDGAAIRPAEAPASRHDDRDIDADFIRKLFRAEQSRSRVIGGKILGDPAWNILLDLLAASSEGRKVSVSSSCIVSGAATTTALRLINRMVDDGVLLRTQDESDGRRSFLTIEPGVEQALRQYLVDLARL